MAVKTVWFRAFAGTPEGRARDVGGADKRVFWSGRSLPLIDRPSCSAIACSAELIQLTIPLHSLGVVQKPSRRPCATVRCARLVARRQLD